MGAKFIVRLPIGFRKRCVYYTRNTSTAANLRDMTTDLHNIFYGSVTDKAFTGVLPVGDAFQRAVDTNVVKADNFLQSRRHV